MTHGQQKARRPPWAEARRRRIQAVFGVMPEMDYQGACAWLHRHPMAAAELFRAVRNAGAIRYAGAGRWRGIAAGEGDA